MKPDDPMAPNVRGIPPPGYRLPAGLRLGAVRLQVGDLDRSVAYYEHVIGFRVAARAGGRARLAAHGDETVLLELHERDGAAPVRPYSRLGLYHFAILLPDRPALGRFVARLSAAGERTGAADHGVSEAIYLYDPDGLGIEVYADRPRAEWRYDGRELLMRTDPLDLGAVMAAGRGEPWSGLPAGTTIGHVHLHVGDLDAAARFYHGVLGFDQTAWSYPGALFLSAGGYHHHLGLNVWARNAVRPGEGEARLLEWEMVLPAPELPEAIAALSAAGHGVQPVGEGTVVRDPWGTAARVVHR